MVGLVVAAHGRLAEELVATAEQIVGPIAGVKTVGIEPGSTPEVIRQKMRDAVHDLDSGEGVLVPTSTLLRYLQPAYATLDASIGIAKDKWHAELYGTNLTNSQASTFTSSAQYIKAETPLRPLVVGLRIGASF